LRTGCWNSIRRCAHWDYACRKWNSTEVPNGATVGRGGQDRHPQAGGLHDEKIQRKVQTLLATVVAALGHVVPSMNDLRRRDLAVMDGINGHLPGHER